MNTHDVAVIGAGPVGLTTALLLAQRGASVVVVEQATGPSDLPRAISIADETFRTLDGLGLADALKAESLLDTGSKYLGRGDRVLAIAKPAPSRTGHPAKSQFDQPVLERLLWDAAVAHEGVDLRTGMRATEVVQDAGGVTVAAEGRDGERHALRAAWVVGADGGHSLVREALGVELVGSTQQERWIVVDLLNVPGTREPYAEFHGDGERPYVLVPGIKGRLRLEYMLFDHEDPETMTSQERIEELVRPVHPTIAPGDIRRAAVYVAHRRVAQTYRVRRGFLAGDAAHLMPPFSGQGLNAGIRDATNLSWKLSEVLRGAGTERLLDSYEAERRPHGARMVRVSHLTGSVVMATGGLATRARDLVFTAARLVPPVHAYLSSMRFITPPDYRDGAAVRSGRAVTDPPGAVVGRALSQPQVTDADGTTAGLDSWLGPGWALLATGPMVADPFSGLDPYWQALGARRIRLLRDGRFSTEQTAYLELTDTSGSFRAPTASPKTQYIAVRPDRYVAAVFTADDEAHVVARLRAYVDGVGR